MVVSCYNKVNVIPYTIDLLKKSCVCENPIIVVEDGSKDDTLKELKDIEGIDLIKNKSNKGWAYSNNKALERVQTEFVVFLDADFLIGTYGWLETWLAHNQNNYGLGESGELHYCPDLYDLGAYGFLSQLEWVKKRKDEISSAIRSRDNSRRVLDHIGGNYKIFRTSLLKAAGGFQDAEAPYLVEVEISFRLRALGYLMLPYRVPYRWTMLRGEERESCVRHYLKMRDLIVNQKREFEESGALLWFPSNLVGKKLFYRS